MPYLLSLREQADRITKLRGHTINWGTPCLGGRDFQSGICQHCKMQVHLETRPYPSDAHIEGKAIRIDCPI